MDLSAKSILVTGAASGIGRKIAEALARAGARLFLTDIDERGGIALTEELAKAHEDVHFQVCDVSDGAQVKASVEAAISALGLLDCAVNNAGVDHPLKPLIDCDEAMFDHVVGVNLKGVFLCMKHQIPAMLAAGTGSIVNVASIAGLIGAPSFAVYSASKHGVVGLTKSAAIEYGPAGIRINAVCPGYINTPMFDRSAGTSSDLQERLSKRIPLRRIGQPEEIAAAVGWLCDDASGYMSGQCMVLDGGLTS